MFYIDTLYNCDITLYFKSVNQYFGISLQNSPKLSNEDINNLCLSGYLDNSYDEDKRIHIFFKDFLYLDFGDTSYITNSFSHNNRYKPILKTKEYTIDNIIFFNKDYILSFLTYNFTNKRINGHIYLEWVFLKKIKNNFYFNGKVLYSTIGIPSNFTFKNMVLSTIEKIEDTNVYEIITKNGLQFFVKNIYKTKDCKHFFETVNQQQQNQQQNQQQQNQTYNNMESHPIFNLNTVQDYNSDSDETIIIDTFINPLFRGNNNN